MDSYQIFISYRRDGGDALAGRLADRLRALGYKVFFDVESMRSGTFNTQILDALAQCNDVLLVLPPNALDRCINEDDWVRQEIAFALKNSKNIIPVMMRGFTFPAYLPEDIDNVRNMEGLNALNEYFDAMITRLCDLMDSVPLGDEKKESENFKNGVRFLDRKMYAQALMCFETEIGSNISDPEPYFYGAVAKLAGKRPFLASRSVIGEIEKYLDTAIAFGECALYYYLYAYIKYDYYEGKRLKSIPSSQELLFLAEGLGISEDEKIKLFEMMGVQRPLGF